MESAMTGAPKNGQQDSHNRDGDDGIELGRIRRLYRSADAVPPELYDRVRFALDLGDAERELAMICADLRPALAVRGPEKPRTITFEAELITIIITITGGDRGLSRFDGWLSPGGRLEVELRAAGCRRQIETDDDGRFVLEDIPPGEVQLAVRSTPASTVTLPRTVVTQVIVL